MHIFLDNKPTFSQFRPAALTCLFIIKKNTARQVYHTQHMSKHLLYLETDTFNICNTQCQFHFFFKYMMFQAQLDNSNFKLS